MQEKDLMMICDSEFIPWSELRGKTLLITGATGLVGSNLIEALLYANRKKSLGLNVLASVRDENKASTRFGRWLEEDPDSLEFILADVEQLSDIPYSVDYIIHGAGITSSEAFVKQPVETIDTAILGTENILKIARQKKIGGMVYLSSMEVYSCPEKGHKVSEDEAGELSPLQMRNSYPLSKQLCEMLCCAYAGEYDVPVKIARLAQTFGPGADDNDHRIFAEFGRCVREKRDIILKTKGESERSYLYTADAVTAILTILLKGIPGSAYNAADEKTYCSIAEMAQKAASYGGVNVRYDLQDEEENGFPGTSYMDLDTTRLRDLGWSPLHESPLLQ